MPKNRNLREVLIFFFHSKKTAAEAHRELQKVYGDAALSETTCRDWFRRFKDGDFDVDDRQPTTLGLTLPNSLKPTWKRSNGKPYPTRCIPQILRCPIISCSGRRHMVWLISSSAYIKTSKNGLIRG